MEIIYLGHLKNIDIIKALANDNSAYIYFICFRGSDGVFQLDSRIIDLEVDCRELKKKYRITNFKFRSERTGHFVTKKDCELNSRGEKIYEELKENGICNKLKTLIESENNLTRMKFNSIFYEKFSFDINPKNNLQIKIKESSKEYNVDFPNKEIAYCNMSVYPILKNNHLYYKFKIKCFCSNIITDEIDMVNYNGSFSITCNNCLIIYHVVYDFKSYW